MSGIERVAVLFNTASRWVAASAWPSRSRPSNSISASIPPGLGGIRIPTGSLPLVITRGPDFGRFRRTFAVSFESSRVFKRSVFIETMSDIWVTFVKRQFPTPPLQQCRGRCAPEAWGISAICPYPGGTEGEAEGAAAPIENPRVGSFRRNDPNQRQSRPCLSIKSKQEGVFVFFQLRGQKISPVSVAWARRTILLGTARSRLRFRR